MSNTRIIALLIFFLAPAIQSQDRALTVQDIMKFRHINGATISENGQWAAFASEPDRGDGEGVVRATGDDRVYRVPRGQAPLIDKTGRWAVIAVKPAALEVEKAGADKKKREKLKPGLVLVDLSNGGQASWEKIKAYAFSDDGRWLARLSHEPRPKEEAAGAEDAKSEPEASPAEPEAKPESQTKPAEPEAKSEPEAKPAEPETKAKPKQEPAADAKAKKGKKKVEKPGTLLTLRRLADGAEFEIDGVASFAFEPKGRWLVYALSLPKGEGNGLFHRDLNNAPDEAVAIVAAAKVAFPKMAWSHDGERLAFLQKDAPPEKQDDGGEDEPESGKKPAEQPEPTPACSLTIWRPAKNALEPVDGLPEKWFTPGQNQLTWSKDNQRLFFGLKPEAEPKAEGADKKADEEMDETALFDIDRMRKKRGLDVWHHKDPRIKPQEKRSWNNEKNRTYTAVYHVRKKKAVQLANLDYPQAALSEHKNRLLLSSFTPYLWTMPWRGPLNDHYAVDLKDGKRTLIAKEMGFFAQPTLSPGGRYAAYFQDGHVHLIDLETGSRRNLTQNAGVPFANEDHDYPSPSPGYGYGGWLEKDRALLIYDKYDIWQAPTDGGEIQRLTAGRERLAVFRLVDTDQDRRFYKPGEKALLRVYYDKLKHSGFWQMEIGKPGAVKLVEGPKHYQFVAKAKKADTILFTREDFREFPNLWTADLSLGEPRQLTDENPQIAEFAWGDPELVEWRDLDGETLQGVLIKPNGFEAGKPCPVIVYFYRFFSQRMYRFNQMRVNHRPNFPFYTSNGYAVFLPDIRFEIGRPGVSAVEALVPGIQELIDMGVADPDAIGLHGHSWSGYQTMHVITQTDAFACAVSGAPVGNMTSAYNGLRRGTGWARQFQYETGQSRIGASLWERRDLYIENSPVFFADRINTPTLIMFGDRDNAVPWEQGIELYLAMRRNGKDVIFLQYHDEPHHLQRYPNKVDYTLKMKEYFDHYLKGEPAAEWIVEGAPYRGKP